MGNCHTNNEKIPVDGRVIVDRVLAGEFTEILKTDKYEEIESKDFYVDTAANLKGIATDFVVKEFFKTDSSLFNFMEIIYTTYSEIINYYRSVRFVNVSGDARLLNEDELFFIHKGGNVLRIVSTEFLLELPASVSRELSTFYSPFFKRSDADFSIYISPYIEDYDKVYEEVGIISFLTLDYLRNIFIENPENYFDYFKYNMLVKNEILHKHLMRFNHIEGYKFESLSVGTGGKGVNNDVVVIPSSEKMVRRITLDKYNPVFINSYNSALDIVRNNRRAKFTLARTKVSLAL